MRTNPLCDRPARLSFSAAFVILSFPYLMSDPRFRGFICLSPERRVRLLPLFLFGRPISRLRYQTTFIFTRPFRRPPVYQKDIPLSVPWNGIFAFYVAFDLIKPAVNHHDLPTVGKFLQVSFPQLPTPVTYSSHSSFLLVHTPRSRGRSGTPAAWLLAPTVFQTPEAFPVQSFTPAPRRR